MTEIPFEFQGFTLKQCEILALLNKVLEIDSNLVAKKDHVGLIYSRFTGPPLDKQWDGVKREAVQLFSELKKELSEEQWKNAPQLVLSFFEHFSEFAMLKGKFDLAVKARDLADKIEREKQLAQARAKRLEAQAKANLKAVKILNNQLTKERAADIKARSQDDYCKHCGQLLLPYSGCQCG